MDQVFWYMAGTERRGPFEQSEIAGLILAGTIARETLVWDSGVNEWLAAAAIAALAPLFEGPVPPGAPAPPPPGPARVAPVPGPLRADFPVWGLLWRSFVRGLGYLFVIPAPWAAVFYNRFLCSRVALPNGAALHFDGRAMDIWYIHIAIAILGLGPFYSKSPGFVFTLAVIYSFLNILLRFYALRWIVAKLRAVDGSLDVKFTGDALRYIGWYFLVALSGITIIGWAWALKYQSRWLCRNVEGTHRFEFTATGLDILWRGLALIGQFFLGFALFAAGIFGAKSSQHAGLAILMFLSGAAVLIALLWTIRWLFNWWISAISVIN